MGTIDQVRTGMHVVDSTGADVGKVDDVKMGDPQAATDSGQGEGSEGLLQNVAAVFGGAPDLHPQAAAQLLRTGYLRIDRKGLFGGHGYVGADKVDRVDGDTVHLGVPGDQLLG